MSIVSRNLRLLAFVGLGLTLNLSDPLGAKAEEKIAYSRDIQPILAKACFACHGNDEASRQAELQLSLRESALQSGAIVPNKPEESELVRRIFSDDEFERMPPPDAGETLSDSQKQKLKTWIAQGANYEQHWAFAPPVKPKLPPVKRQEWCKNPIDRFILAKLEEHDLEPSAEADRYTLVRRLYLDLIGLPPTPEEADAFANDASPDAYEKLVDRLLDSKQYGERWARVWLDLARYADTNGYEKDRPRSIWPYRDWVIKAINDDMPYDEFTIKQLAGDMLPEATPADRVATGFHRNTMLNEEGGIDPLEYRFHAMVDRVATTGTVWLGLTTGCAQCHSHKYDAISHTDYYRLMALLNNADEPDLAVKSHELMTKRQAVEKRIADLMAKLPSKFPPVPGEGDVEIRRKQNLDAQFSKWIEGEEESATLWTPLRPAKLESNLPRLEILADGSIFSSGDITKRDVYRLEFLVSEEMLPLTAIRLEALPDERLPAGGPGRAYYEGRKGDFFLSELSANFAGKTVEFAGASHSYGKISIGSGTAEAKNVIDADGSTGWSTSGREGEAHQLVVNLKSPIRSAGKLDLTLLFERHFAASLGRFRVSATSSDSSPKASSLPVEIERLIAFGIENATRADQKRVRDYYLGIAPELAEARKEIENLKAQLPSFPMTMVFEERPDDNPRTTYRHHRGEYLSPKEEVSPGVPSLFEPLPEDQPGNRLTFARWLVSERNPMAGRLPVNRAWRAFFGNGLVRTNGDYGTQSDPPTHPELLDWLASEFTEQGWSRKKLHRMIVLSATYRQASTIDPAKYARDPENRWLSRSPRYLVDAEIVRDMMLKSSGLLSEKIGGPSVYPPQPASVTALAYGNTAWKPSAGEDRFRRSLYTFSKRTAPFAAYQAFNAPTGENCITKRDKTGTPLQALTLLNDEMFLEMARALAKEAAKSETPKQTAVEIFRRLLTRPPTDEELDFVMEYFQKQKTRLEAGELDAGKIAAQKGATSEFAAWIMLARALMNLEETITRH